LHLRADKGSVDSGGLVPGSTLFWTARRDVQLMATREGLGAFAAHAFDPEQMPHTHLELGALPTAVPCARLHVKHVLREWQQEGLVDTVELVVSELVTNAVQASAGLLSSEFAGHWAPGLPPVRLWLAADGQFAVVQVWDASEDLPERQEAELDADSGRGLVLVDSLADDWGSYTPEASSGKVVWAVVSDPEPPAAT
jgi:anti-sigma regulatory factor (Ser/Thr protein kinase)